MPLPKGDEYNQAVQATSICFRDDADLCGTVAKTDRNGLPIGISGGSGDVFKLQRTGVSDVWAVKCFTREVPDLKNRYREISHHLQIAKRRGFGFTEDFQLVDRGILVNGARYPILKMKWVEGTNLNAFVKNNADKPQVLLNLATLWQRMARELRAANIAHGDLQHGNVILLPTTNNTPIDLRLIDYDGMFVPALAGQKPGECGHPNYQHPQRANDPYHFEMDRFSNLVVLAALHCVAAGGSSLWCRYDNSENLLFRKRDFQNPASSPLFQELWNLPHPPARILAGRLMLACLLRPEFLPLLDDIAPNGQPTPLSRTEKEKVAALLQSSSPPRGSSHGAPVNRSVAPSSTPFQQQSRLPSRSRVIRAGLQLLYFVARIAAGIVRRPKLRRVTAIGLFVIALGTIGAYLSGSSGVIRSPELSSDQAPTTPYIPPSSTPDGFGNGDIVRSQRANIARQHVLRGIEAASRDDHPTACDEFSAALELQRGDAVTHVRRALSYFKVGQPFLARDDCMFALSIENNLDDARLVQAWAMSVYEDSPSYFTDTTRISEWHALKSGTVIPEVQREAFVQTKLLIVLSDIARQIVDENRWCADKAAAIEKERKAQRALAPYRDRDTMEGVRNMGLRIRAAEGELRDRVAEARLKEARFNQLIAWRKKGAPSRDTPEAFSSTGRDPEDEPRRDFGSAYDADPQTTFKTRRPPSRPGYYVPLRRQTP